MLTGPVTIVAWSFVREDLPLPDVTRQVADAIRDEVADLQAAGIRVIQVDEPALRELMPLRSDAAVGVPGVGRRGVPARDVVGRRRYADTHAPLLLGRDSDPRRDRRPRRRRDEHRVGPLGRARVRVRAGLGPGVYDIHSPRIPSVDEVSASLRAALEHVPAERLWVNPDCGLKTRTYAQVEAALSNVVTAALSVRASLPALSSPGV